MTQKIQTYEWSFAPRAAYTIEHQGRRIGIGADPVFEAVPGAWNILQLSCKVLDTLLPWTGAPEDFPDGVGAMPAAVGTALQWIDNKTTVGMWASAMTPEQFITTFSPLKTQLILWKIAGDPWWNLALERAQMLNKVIPPNAGKVIRGVDFKNKAFLH